MTSHLSENPREWRIHLGSLALALGLLAYLLNRRGVLSVRGAVGIGALLLLLVIASWIRPRWVRPVYRASRSFGAMLGYGMTIVVLTLFFWLVVTPLGWALRLAGNDLLGLQRRAGITSYWRKVRPPGPLDRMF